MNTSGEAADQVVRMMLEGTEVLVRLTGSGAKNTAVLLYSVLREQKKTAGAARLSSMLRSGKLLKVYTFEEKDLPKFTEVAKEYGILYTILKKDDKTGGVFDVLVRADDENKLARIVERFHLSRVDNASLRAEIVKEREEQAKTEADAKEGESKESEAEKDDPDAPEQEKSVSGEEKNEPERSYEEEQIVEKLMGEPTKEGVTPNPAPARTEKPSESKEPEEPNPSKSPDTASRTTKEADPRANPEADALSEPISAAASGTESKQKEKESQATGKRSVKQELQQIRARRQQETDAPGREQRTKSKGKER